jgi:hypothetical protein
VRTNVAPAITGPGRLFEPPGGELSLEDAILSLCDELGRAGEADCPVCAGRLRSGAACDSCGSALS